MAAHWLLVTGHWSLLTAQRQSAMRKPLFKRRWMQVLLALVSVLILGAWLFYQSLFYMPRLPPIEPLPPSVVGGGATFDVTAPFRKVQAEVQQLAVEEQLGKERDYELSLSETDMNRLIARVLAEGKLPGTHYAEQMQVRFAGGEVSVITIAPIAKLAARWHAIQEYLPGGWASSERLICITARARPVLVNANTLTMEPQSVLIGRVRLPSYVVDNVIEKVAARAGIGPEGRTVQVPGLIKEVVVEDGWFRVRGRTEKPGDPQTRLQGGSERIEKLLNRFLEMVESVKND
ncbi:MAG: hypothetical protein NZT92_06500 [Abditibacteriales bacterium]|nr:hypothetical protein [Abditibacteriales bacterium]MDW8365679.1 hypothetical protein [Abditibacteriales bacterium]